MKLVTTSLFALACMLPLLVSVDGHSWVIKVGLDGGNTRGGTVEPPGSDLDQQRYFCPLSTVAECQPESKHNVFLTDENLRPCRAGVESYPRSQIVAGDSLYLKWMGNGHTQGESDDTCVRVMLAPYTSDPSFDEFDEIAACVEYWRYDEEGNQKTDAYIQIPSNVVPGRYTVFWLWDFYPFWFSSCADIDVLSSGPVAPTGNPVAPVGSPVTPMPVTIAPTTDDGDLDNDIEIYLHQGCGVDSLLPGTFCSDVFGSYCKDYQADSCGRSVCHGDSHDSMYECDTDATDDSVLDPLDTYLAGGCTAVEMSSFCADHNGGYCKDYQSDGCGRSVCHGDSHSVLNPCP